MPFTHKVLAYCDATEDLKDSGKREELAHAAYELAREFAASISTDEHLYRAIVHVDVVPAGQ